MSAALYSLLRRLMHVVYAIVATLAFNWNVLRHQLDYLLDDRRIDDDDDEYLRRGVKRLEKRLAHVAVLLGNEHDRVSWRDLRRLAVWAASVGVDYISFYDHKGALIRDRSKLVNSVRLLDEATRRKIAWGKSFDTYFPPETKTNGVETPTSRQCHRITVNVFGLADGRGEIESVTRKLCTSDVDAVPPEVIDEMLRQRLGVPDPDLAVYCGDSCSTFGFLPWHLRLTEFLPLKTHRRIKVEDFMSLLCQYDATSQRFGK